MSIPAFAWAIERGRGLGLSPAERLVLIYLADKANGAKVCWPRQETIRSFTGLALRTIRSALHSLATHRLIRMEDSPGLVTRYHILRDDTPANSAEVPKPNGEVIHSPGKASLGRPPRPRQNVSTHPGKSCLEPRDISTGTPAICCDEPYLTQNQPEERGACAPEGKSQNLDSGGKEASQQAADDPDDRVPEEALIALRKQLGRTLRHQEFAPGRPSVRSIHEQIAAGEAPPLDAPLPKPHPAVLPAVLAARQQLMAQAAMRQAVAA